MIDSFLPTAYKFGMIFTIIHRCIRICSSYSNFHFELQTVKGIFRKNGYSISFIDRCIRTFLDKLHAPELVITTVGKKTLFIVLPYLGNVSELLSSKLQDNLEKLVLLQTERGV